MEPKLEHLLMEEVIETVRHAEWAAPIEQYLFPRIEDLFVNLSEGEKFSKLDLSYASHQSALDEESNEYVTVHTQRGLFTYRVLPSGVSYTSAHSIPYVTILITGLNDQEHLETLIMVLQRLQCAGLRVRRSKCTFMGGEVTFLGHKVDSTGLHPVSEKVRAIENAPTPSNVTKFPPNLATVLAPQHKLLCEDTKWKWDKDRDAAFTHSKRLLQSAEVLTVMTQKKRSSSFSFFH